MSRVNETIERYRAKADQAGIEEQSEEILGYLMAVCEAKPQTADEAEIKLQFLLEERVDNQLESENYEKIIMQAYLERLMLDF